MWQTRSEEAAADAKTAEGASCTAHRTPSPPNFTGKVACSQAGSDSSKWMLVIPLTIDRNVLLYTSKAGERKHGDVLRLYNSFGMAKECFRRRMASWEERCTSLSPIFFSKAVFSSKILLMEEILPTEDPTKDASLGFTHFAFRSKLAKGAAVSSFPQITSDFPEFRDNPSTHQPASQPPDVFYTSP